ncbi:MAG: SagB/ThcOx family dehydrogenase [Desulfobacteraceae bacterium]|nr:SagB/ThcOx family dehydrogenase [Desulfobacteraceae bacterium]
MSKVESVISLPKPELSGSLSLESALAARRSVRSYRDAPLKIHEVSQLLWAAQGVTHPRGYRTSPSAGALYPIQIRLIVGAVEDLQAGIYRYHPDAHVLSPGGGEDVRQALADASLGQSMLARAPAVIAISAIFDRTTSKYRERGIRYVYMEAGHVAQNVHLQAVSLSLGTVVVGAFQDERVAKALSLDPVEEPLLLMPVGR